MKCRANLRSRRVPTREVHVSMSPRSQWTATAHAVQRSSFGLPWEYRLNLVTEKIFYFLKEKYLGNWFDSCSNEVKKVEVFPKFEYFSIIRFVFTDICFFPMEMVGINTQLRKMDSCILYGNGGNVSNCSNLITHKKRETFSATKKLQCTIIFLVPWIYTMKGPVGNYVI